MRFLAALLSDNGSVSCMRTMSLLCCLAAICIAVMGLNKPQPDYSGLALICTTFLGAAFGGKVVQKSIEAKGVKIEEKSDS